MNPKNSNELIARYLLGTISHEEMERLDVSLKTNPAFRQTFSAAARLDANLREAALEFDGEAAQHFQRKSPAKGARWAGLAAAAALILGAYLFPWPHAATDSIARIVEVGGSLRWTGDGGQVRDGLAKGLSLSGGTLESLSADSWVEIVFQDGSRMALSGQSSMTFSQSNGRKFVRLREGSLSANVTTMQQDNPVRFITPTVEAEVLATQFTLKADSTSTRLTVYEGRVRVTRLADGSTNEVPADHFAVVTLDTAENFLALPREQYVNTWRSSLPFGIGHGDWEPARDGQPGRLRAKPLLWKEYDRHMVLHLASLSASDEEHRTALLKAGAHVRIVGRLAEDCEVHFGLTTHRIGGGFAGKYIASRELPGSEETFAIDLPIASFNRQYPCFPESLIGHELVDWWALTIDNEAGLEILSVELLAP